MPLAILGTSGELLCSRGMRRLTARVNQPQTLTPKPKGASTCLDVQIQLDRKTELSRVRLLAENKGRSCEVPVVVSCSHVRERERERERVSE